MKDIQFYLNGYLKDEKKIYSWTITSKQVQQLIKLQEKVKKSGGFVAAKGSTYYGEQVTFAPTEVTTEPKEKNFYTTLDADKIFWVVDIYIEKDEKFRIEVPLSKAEKKKRKEEVAEDNAKRWEELKLEEDAVAVLTRFFNPVTTINVDNNKGIYIDKESRTSLSSLVYAGGSSKQEVSFYIDYTKKHIRLETLSKLLNAWAGVEAFRIYVERFKLVLRSRHGLTLQAAYCLDTEEPLLSFRIGYVGETGFSFTECTTEFDTYYGKRLSSGEQLKFNICFPNGLNMAANDDVRDTVTQIADFVLSLEQSKYPRFAQVLKEAQEEAYELGIYAYTGVNAYRHPELSSDSQMGALIKQI